MTGLEAWRRHDAGWVELETADAPCALTRGEDAVPLGGCAKRQIGLTVAGVTCPGLTTVFLHSLLQLALLGCLIPVRAAEQTPRSAPNTWGLTSWSGAGNGGSGLPVGPRAFVNGHTALYPFKRVRLVLANLNDTPLTVRGLRARASGDLDAYALDRPMARVTFDGADEVTLPPRQGDARQVAAALDVSDVLAIGSVPRTDGGTLPVLQLSGHITVAQPACLHGRGPADVTAFRDHVRNPWHHTQVADSRPVPFEAMDEQTGRMTPAGGAYLCPAVVFDYGVPCASLLVVGESLQAAGFAPGSLSQAGGIGLGQAITLLARERGARVSAHNCAQNGQRHDQMLAIAREWLRLVREKGLPLTHIVFPAASVNSGINPVSFDAVWRASVKFADECVAAGVVPVMLTSPSMGYGDDLVAAQNVRTRASGYTVADVADGWDAATMAHPVDHQHWTIEGELHAAGAVLKVVRPSQVVLSPAPAVTRIDIGDGDFNGNSRQLVLQPCSIRASAWEVAGGR